MTTVNMPGGEIVPVGAARRDRLRRVGRRRRGPAPRPAQRVEVPLHPGHAREQLHRRVIFNTDVWKSSHAAAAGAVQARRCNDTFIAGGRVAEAERRRDRGDAQKHGVQILRTPPEILIEFLKTWDKIAAEEVGEEPVLQEGATSRSASTRREGRAGEALHVPAVLVRGELLLARAARHRGADPAEGADRRHRFRAGLDRQLVDHPARVGRVLAALHLPRARARREGADRTRR
jgi:hypothetical protein